MPCTQSSQNASCSILNQPFYVKFIAIDTLGAQQMLNEKKSYSNKFLQILSTGLLLPLISVVVRTEQLTKRLPSFFSWKTPVVTV